MKCSIVKHVGRRALPAGAPSATLGMGGCTDLSVLKSEELRGQGDG